MPLLEHDQSWPRKGMRRLEHDRSWTKKGMLRVEKAHCRPSECFRRLEHNQTWPRKGMPQSKNDQSWPKKGMPRQKITLCRPSECFRQLEHNQSWPRKVMPRQENNQSWPRLVILKLYIEHSFPPIEYHRRRREPNEKTWGKCGEKENRNCLTSNLQMLGNSYLNKKVPQAGVEPARPFGPRDFKSLVSTDSTIRADLSVTKRCRISFLTGANIHHFYEKTNYFGQKM